MAAAGTHAPGSKVLLQGLELLRLLAQCEGPVSATALAEKTGQHPSTVSRLLSGLVRAGYVRKPDYHSFAPDLGLATLFGQVRRHFPLTRLPRAALRAQAVAWPGMRWSLATLHEHQLVYWLAVEADQEEAELIVSGYPLHLSSIALRILVDRPVRAATALLAASRRWNGWERPTDRVPADAATVLAMARDLLSSSGGECLVLESWQGEGRISAALPIRSPDDRPLVLAVSGPTPALLDRDLEPATGAAALIARMKVARAAVEAAIFS
jgi:DNA-binding IclR family transcriptional regulator